MSLSGSQQLQQGNESSEHAVGAPRENILMNVLLTTQVPLPFFNSAAETFVLQHRYCILCRPQPPCQVRGVLIVTRGVFIDRQAPGDYILQHQPAHGNR